jgi:hypothetical protein
MLLVKVPQLLNFKIFDFDHLSCFFRRVGDGIEIKLIFRRVFSAEKIEPNYVS